MIVFSFRLRWSRQRREFRWVIRVCNVFVAIRFRCCEPKRSYCTGIARLPAEMTEHRTKRAATRLEQEERFVHRRNESRTSSPRSHIKPAKVRDAQMAESRMPY